MVQRCSLRVSDFINSVSQLDVLWRAVGINNVPKRLCLRWRCLWIELRDISLCEKCGDVAVAASVVPLPEPVEVVISELFLLEG
jgi:hypothetical protein